MKNYFINCWNAYQQRKDFQKKVENGLSEEEQIMILEKTGNYWQVKTLILRQKFSDQAVLQLTQWQERENKEGKKRPFYCLTPDLLEYYVRCHGLNPSNYLKMMQDANSEGLAGLYLIHLKRDLDLNQGESSDEELKNLLQSGNRDVVDFFKFDAGRIEWMKMYCEAFADAWRDCEEDYKVKELTDYEIASGSDFGISQSGYNPVLNRVEEISKQFKSFCPDDEVQHELLSLSPFWKNRFLRFAKTAQSLAQYLKNVESYLIPDVEKELS